MSINQTNLNSATEAYATYATTRDTKKSTKSVDEGNTVGNPKLSDEGQKYYDKLKKKFGNMEFVLVSTDMKKQAQANASSYANPVKPVVLIDEEKIEKMATDASYRKKYERIISGATANLSNLKTSIESSGMGANVKGYGMQVNDGGNTSFFAVLKKSSTDQKTRIAKKAEATKAAKKAAAKKADAKKDKDKVSTSKDKTNGIKDDDIDIDDSEDTITISASSIEELMKKLEDYAYNEKSNNVMTSSEREVGQNIDFRG